MFNDCATQRPWKLIFQPEYFMAIIFHSLQDLYIDRPLPYLIGSKLFMEQEDVGLGELSSEGILLFF